MKFVMKRQTLRLVHRAGAVAALLLPACFLLASVGAELTRSAALVAEVKRGVLLAIPALVVVMAVTALSGRRLAGASRHRIVRRKTARLTVVAPVALLVLVPAAVVLDRLASAGALGMPFPIVQGVELAAGALNVTLLALNVRDGLRLRPRRAAGVRRHNHQQA